MSSRRVEEVDTNGRRRVTILEEEPAVQATDQEVAGEEEAIQVHPDTWNVARGWVRTFGAFVAVAFAVIETLLMFRFGFLLAGANPNNGFVDFIYDISGGLVDPFEGIVAADTVGDGVFEPASLIALVVYAAVALLLMMLLWAASSAPSASGDRAVTTRSRHRTREIRGE
jgi:nitrate/nitrite transporter NarK